MKFGFDLHGVIDTNPKFFSEFTKFLVDGGHEVHILTGPKRFRVRPDLKEMGIVYTHLFSIHEWALENKHEVIKDVKGDPHVDPYIWDKAKGEYAKEHELDLHLDDSDIYGYFFKTPYARFYSKDSDRTRKIKL